ncbi:hypothetical protein [Vibrio salinus]|uniref:hypothetical protein n=1 Tax=Vibrio salinus TaxID=2899784 RepID=UPI001E4ED847|nr:hypothetical protein [Vibrio salinus]MCE0494899.1 hypothetical protein [Vibrio salinus]
MYVRKIEGREIMDNLFTYVSLIKNSPESEWIVKQTVEQETVEDDWSVSHYSEQLFTFKNGVVIRKCMEKELGDTNPDIVCEECFINYEVLAEPEHLNVSPKSKNFINLCQEAFWLKINKAQNQQ